MKEMIETMPRIELALIIIGVLFTRTSRENDKGLYATMIGGRIDPSSCLDVRSA